MSKTAFDAKRGNLFRFDPKELLIIGLDTKDGPEHPLYDERIKLPIDEALVRSIMSKGVIKPVLVRKNGDKAEVVDGRRRVRHAREANKRLHAAGEKELLIAAVVREGEDKELYAVSLSANEMNHTDNVVAKARKLQKFFAMGGVAAEAAVDFGVSPATITNWGKLLKLDAKVLKLVEDDKLSASAAATLSELEREKQHDAALALIEAGATSHKAAAQAVKRGRPAGAGGDGDGAAAKRTNRKRSNGVSPRPSMKLLEEVADTLNTEVAPSQARAYAIDIISWVLGQGDAPPIINQAIELIEQDGDAE